MSRARFHRPAVASWAGSSRATAGKGGVLTEISEKVVVAEAQVVASRLVEWFRDRLLTAEEQRDAADEARVSAEDDRRVSDHERAEAERRVVEVERLLVASEELAEQLQQALDTRIVIEQAKGFLAARYGVTPDAAFQAMRRYARNNRVTLRDVAADAMTGTPHLEL